LRDNFSRPIKEALARRVNYLCSNPDCLLATVGPHSEASKYVNKGVAAHITAASPSGMRYDGSFSHESRSSAENGIWLCQNCAKVIDSDAEKYTVELLKSWKTVAESRAADSVTSNKPLINAPEPEELEIRASYGSDPKKSLVHISIFNRTNHPIYLEGWIGSWCTEGKRASITSCTCVTGKFPFRIPGQDIYRVMVDIGGRGFDGFERIGISGAGNRYWYANDAEVAGIVQQAQRYAKVYPKPDTNGIEAQYKQCDVSISCSITKRPGMKDELTATFANNSEIPIKINGARIKWEFDSPRWSPTVDGSESKVAQTGGNLALSCREDFSSPVMPGCRISCYLHPDMNDCLIETIMGDVPDGNLGVAFYTDTVVSWVEKEEGVWDCI